MAKFPLSCHDDIHILYNVEAIKREYLGDKEKKTSRPNTKLFIGDNLAEIKTNTF